MKTRKSILATALALVFSLTLLAGCGSQTASTTPTSGTQLASGGVLRLKVNPEIAVTYDAEGLVTSVEARNDDGSKILETYTGFEGKECRTVVAELVAAIGEAGYFVEEVGGETRQITIEIESGSGLPSKTFLDDVVAEVRTTVSSNDWSAPVNMEAPAGSGVTSYVDTDYGPNNDGVTDYSAATPAATPAGGTAAVVDTDYGPNNDGVTDYDDTDYGPNNDGVTDYNTAVIYPSDGTVTIVDTDYGPDNDGVTDYDDTDYGPNNDGVTDYDDTSDDGSSNYDDSSDDGGSNYDDGGSSYGDSGYDD